jgi:hypothetical protein
MAFGLEVKQKEFLLDDDTTFLNHGSYGTAPKTVFEHRIKLASFNVICICSCTQK